MRKKRIINTLRIITMLLAVLVMMCLGGCGGNSGGSPVSGSEGRDDPAAGDKTVNVVTTIFPAYDLAKTVAGEDVINSGAISLTLLADNGVDLHSYQPTAKDIIAIKSCDVLVFVGGESDAWVSDVIAEGANEDMIVVNMMDAVGGNVKLEEHVEGMTGSEEEHSGSEDTEEEEYDEHVWLSLNNGSLITGEIGEALAAADPDDAETYRNNASRLSGEMQALDREYRDAVSASDKKTMVFGDRFPFRYMMDDYGLSYYAAFDGCSAESEASFETITFLAGKIDELGLKYVITTGSRGDKIAEAVIRNTASKDQQILVLDDMQAATTAEELSYMDRMRGNLETIKTALS